jgi:hypothetical protein
MSGPAHQLRKARRSESVCARGRPLDLARHAAAARCSRAGSSVAFSPAPANTPLDEDVRWWREMHD